MKSIKKALAIILIILAIISLSGCSNVGKEIEKSESGSVHFKCLNLTIIEQASTTAGNHYIMVDEDTGVLYYCMSSGYKYGVTQLAESDGTPKLYKDYYEQVVYGK